MCKVAEVRKSTWHGNNRIQKTDKDEKVSSGQNKAQRTFKKGHVRKSELNLHDNCEALKGFEQEFQKNLSVIQQKNRLKRIKFGAIKSGGPIKYKNHYYSLIKAIKFGPPMATPLPKW